MQTWAVIWRNKYMSKTNLLVLLLNLERDKQRIIVSLIAVITRRWLCCQNAMHPTLRL